MAHKKQCCCSTGVECTSGNICVSPKDHTPNNATVISAPGLGGLFNGDFHLVNGDNTGRDDKFCNFLPVLCDGAIIDAVKFSIKVEVGFGNTTPDAFFDFTDNGTPTPVTFITSSGATSGGVGTVTHDGSAQPFVEFEVELTNITTAAQLETLCISMGFDSDINTTLSEAAFVVEYSGCQPTDLSELACANVLDRLKELELNDKDNQILNINQDGELEILGGNTVQLPNSDTDISGITANLTGTDLTVTVTEDGNNFSDTVDLSSLSSNAVNQTLSTTTNPVSGATNSISISDGNTINIAHPGLLVNSQPIYHEHYAGGSVNGTTQSWNRNIILTRTAVGLWNVTFVGAHPDGVEYHPTITAEEQSNLRDTPDITVVQGSKTAGGFQIQITTGDNGSSADLLIDTAFTVAVNSPLTVVTSVAFN